MKRITTLLAGLAGAFVPFLLVCLLLSSTTQSVSADGGAPVCSICRGRHYDWEHGGRVTGDSGRAKKSEKKPYTYPGYEAHQEWKKKNASRYDSMTYRNNEAFAAFWDAWNTRANHGASGSRLWETPLRLFEEAYEINPHPEILYNLRRAREEIVLSSFLSWETVLQILDLTPSILILHPNPYVRKEAHKELARKTLIEIIGAASYMVLVNNDNVLGKWSNETRQERQAKLLEAMRHSAEYESLILQAHDEAGETVRALDRQNFERNGYIRMDLGPAMSQLIQACISGLE